MRKRFSLVVFSCVLFVCALKAQDTCTFMTYNVLNFDNTGNDKEQYLRTVIASVKPDVLVVQELIEASGANRFFDSVILKIDTAYAMGDFINSFDTDNGLYYNKHKFSFIENTVIKTDLRDINRFEMMHLADSTLFYIYSCHLKASDGSENEVIRKQEADSIRKSTATLPDTANYILAGDCNIYGSFEAAYTTLLDNAEPGYFIDPLKDSISGTWNNSSYARYHTQSTRVRNFGGGSTGGMDDRFDLILFSDAINTIGSMYYLESSLTPIGNDGMHFNDSINALPNITVSDEVADALHYSSDHIPVTAKFIFDKSIIDTTVIVLNNTTDETLHIYPNPVKDLLTIKGTTNCNTITIKSLNGKVFMQFTPQHSASLQIDMRNLPEGIYLLEAATETSVWVKKVMKVNY